MRRYLTARGLAKSLVVVSVLAGMWYAEIHVIHRLIRWADR